MLEVAYWIYLIYLMLNYLMLNYLLNHGVASQKQRITTAHFIMSIHHIHHIQHRFISQTTATAAS
jgi:hypothetical protein